MFVFALTVLAAAVLGSPSPPEVPIAGEWVTQGGESVIGIAPCGDAYCGTVLRVLKPDPAISP